MESVLFIPLTLREMARQDRHAAKAQLQARVNGRTQKGSSRERSPAMRRLLASSTGKIDFTPADLVRTRARLKAEGRSVAVAGPSPEVEAAVQRLMQADLPS
jgi:hypothetical protein